MKFGELTNGQKFETSSYLVNKADIIAFATQFDPLYMHVDEEKAKLSRFKGIIAPGLHTLSISHRLWFDLGILGDDVIAGTGINNLKFLNPVFPGDVLFVTVEILKKEESERAGEVTFLLLSHKNNGEQVLSAEISALIAK